MKRALVTGIRGFVGGYLNEELSENGYEVLGISSSPDGKNLCANLLDYTQTFAAVEAANPDVIFHLAGQANVYRSWKDPQGTIQLNVIAAVNLLEAVRELKTEPRIVLVGSSDQYGHLGKAGERVTEKNICRPTSPYAVSKLAQEEMAGVYANCYGMRICMTRSFNHGGAGQKEGFLIPDFAAGIVRIEKGISSMLKVGNLSSRRDFTHVRDVVRAYRLLAEQGQAGEIYNVGSGVTHSAQEILDLLCSMAVCPIPVELDPGKLRPSDTPVICCDHSKLTADTGWQPEIPLETILADTLSFYRKRI